MHEALVDHFDDGQALSTLPGSGQEQTEPGYYVCLSPAQERLKRSLDLVLTPLCILLVAPLMALIAVLIRMTSPGPVIFRQPRVGRFNTLFPCYKFRTMHAHASDRFARQQTIPGDPRITSVGRWLRRFSLDELPQLFNVIKGDMSLVGPRPHAPLTKAGGRLFDEIVENYHQRHGVRPGITGWAQVNGCRGQTKTEEDIIRRVELDLVYVKDWSFWLDIRIICLTAVNEIFSKSAF